MILATRYVIAILTACLITTAGLGFSWHDRQAVREDLRRAILEAETAGELSTDPQRRQLEAMAISVTRAIALQLEMGPRRRTAKLLWKTRYVWIPIVFATSIGVAMAVGRKRDPNAGETAFD